MEISAKLVKELREMTGAGMMDCKKALVENEGDLDKAARWLQEQGIAKSAKKSGRIAAEGIAQIVSDGNKAVVFEVNAETDFVAKNEKFINLVEIIGNTVLHNDVESAEAALELVVDGKTINDLVVEATATIGEKISFRRLQVVNKSEDEVFGKYIHLGGKIAAVAVVKGSEEFAKDIAMQVASMAPQYVSQSEMPASIVEEQTSLQREILSHDETLASKSEQQKEGIIRGRVNKALQEISLVDQVYFKDPSLKVSDFVKQQNGSVTKFTRFAVGEGLEKKEDDFAAEVASMTGKN